MEILLYYIVQYEPMAYVLFSRTLKCLFSYSRQPGDGRFLVDKQIFSEKEEGWRDERRVFLLSFSTQRRPLPARTALCDRR